MYWYNKEFVDLGSKTIWELVGLTHPNNLPPLNRVEKKIKLRNIKIKIKTNLQT